MKYFILFSAIVLLINCGSGSSSSNDSEKLKIIGTEFSLVLEDDIGDVYKFSDPDPVNNEIDLDEVTLTSNEENLTIEIKLVDESSALCDYVLLIGTGSEGRGIKNETEVEIHRIVSLHYDEFEEENLLILGMTTLPINESLVGPTGSYNAGNYSAGLFFEPEDLNIIFGSNVLTVDINYSDWKFINSKRDIEFGESDTSDVFSKDFVLTEDLDFKFYSNCNGAQDSIE